MNNTNLFFNTNIQQSGILSNIADFALSPVRYFFRGRTVSIVDFKNQKHTHHAYSFAKNAFFTSSKTAFNHVTKKRLLTPPLKPSEKNFLKATMMTILFVPGILFGTLAKAFTYISGNVRKNHELAKRHFTRIDYNIGTKDNPKNLAEIKKELTKLRYDRPNHQKAKNLIIYGNEGDEIVGDPGIRYLNAHKTVLVGIKIVNESYPGPNENLHDQLVRREWGFKKVDSVQDALNHSTSSRHTYYHVSES